MPDPDWQQIYRRHIWQTAHRTEVLHGVVDVNNTLVANGELFSRSGSLGDGKSFVFITEKGDFNLSAECCFNERDRNLTVKIHALSVEESVALYVYFDYKITVGATILAC